ncbi:MAG: hypothetical protein QE487_06400 [Fluviicola sp.]|nr:hypothetical protein [Fluviicola sp.]
MKAVILLPFLFSFCLFGQKDTINVTDSLGLKQGHWVYFGGDFPNSGVSSSEILEEGDFVDNQRVGIWYRYGAQSQLKAVMLFRIDRKTKSSVRDQFYNYSYHANGQLKRKPVVGACRSMSDYFEYDEAGLLKEVEQYDSLCNTNYKLQRIEKGEMDSISIFIIDHKFEEQVEATDESPVNQVHFEQTGEFCVDYNHKVFQLGHFEKGQFTNGREYVFDEMMRALIVRFYENGKLVKTVMRKSS